MIRNSKGQFRQGVYGNAGGRPKVIGEVRDLAREYTAEAVETLASIMRNPKSPTPARVAAAQALLDRAWGRSAQQVEVQRSTGFAEMLEQLEQRQQPRDITPKVEEIN